MASGGGRTPGDDIGGDGAGKRTFAARNPPNIYIYISWTGGAIKQMSQARMGLVQMVPFKCPFVLDKSLSGLGCPTSAIYWANVGHRWATRGPKNDSLGFKNESLGLKIDPLEFKLSPWGLR